MIIYYQLPLHQQKRNEMNKYKVVLLLDGEEFEMVVNGWSLHSVSSFFTNHSNLPIIKIELIKNAIADSRLVNQLRK